MSVFIYQKDAKQKIIAVEGEWWVREQNIGRKYSFYAFLRKWRKEIAPNKYLVENGKRVFITIDSIGAFYGFRGYNRYCVDYSGEIFFVKDLAASKEYVEKAIKAGFTIF